MSLPITSSPSAAGCRAVCPVRPGYNNLVRHQRGIAPIADQTLYVAVVIILIAPARRILGADALDIRAHGLVARGSILVRHGVIVIIYVTAVGVLSNEVARGDAADETCGEKERT